VIGLHKLVAMIFAVSFEIIIQRAVSNESFYPMKNTLIIITVLFNRSRKINLMESAFERLTEHVIRLKQSKFRIHGLINRTLKFN
jgi:hypothetical protein